MNAGAYGQEIKDVVVKTTYVDDKGNIKYFSNEEQKFEYRSSIFKDKPYIITEVELKLQRDTELMK